MTLSPTTYLRQLFDPTERVAITLIKRVPGTKTTLDSKQRTALAAELITPKWQRFLRAMNYQGYEIYCAMNPIRPNARGRHKCDIQEVRRLYLDLDEEGDTALQRLLARKDLPPPNIILNTSPHKYQTIWKIQLFTPEAAETFLRALARDTGGDIAATDIARVLRIPGFRNHKYSPPHLVTAYLFHSETFTPAAFPALDLASDQMVRDARRKHTNSHGIDHSRSGIDFGHTIGWLRAGLPHDEILHRLISQRQDKPNPEYYARTTLKNALRISRQCRASRPEKVGEFAPTN